MSNGRTKGQEKEQQEKVNAGDLGLLPKDVVRKMATSYLPARDINFLRSTCLFFSKNKNQELSEIAKSKYKKIFTLDNCTFILDGHGSLYGLGQIPSYLCGNKISGIGSCIPITLPDYEPIAHIAHTWYKRNNKFTSSTIICTKKGTVYGGGDNYCGQLGLGDHKERLEMTFITIPDNKRIIYAAMQRGCSILIADDGTVLRGGYDQCGSLPLGDTPNHDQLCHEQLQVITLPNKNIRIKQGALGHQHTIMLSEEGKVYGCGRNIYNQLGFDKKGFQSLPALMVIPDNKCIQQIVATTDCTILLAKDGTVYGCGLNSHNVFGLTDQQNRSTIPKLTFIPVPGDKPIHYIAAYDCGLFLLASDGTVYRSGYNVNFRMGKNTKANQLTSVSLPEDSRIKQVDIGLHHSIMVTDDHIVYGCGKNFAGQLGFNNTKDISTPTRIDIDDLLLQANQEKKSALRM
jgi:alpha-tubulin suppressor-like RCC1 family protein